jgi:hypothetical protein
MSLSTILEQMNQNRANSEMDVTLGNPSTYNGRLGLKKAAMETMKRLRLEYRNELSKTAAFIVVTGSSRDAFTEFASGEDFGCFSVNPDDFFNDIVSRVKPTLFGRESAKHLFNIVGNILEDKMGELDIASYPSLRYNDKYCSAVNNASDLMLLVRAAVTDQVGSEVVGVNAVHSIVDAAAKNGHSALVTPILLSTEDERFALNMHNNIKKRRHADGTFSGITDRVFMVVAGKASKELSKTEGVVVVKTVTKENVKEALITISSRIL